MHNITSKSYIMAAILYANIISSSVSAARRVGYNSRIGSSHHLFLRSITSTSSSTHHHCNTLGIKPSQCNRYNSRSISSLSSSMAFVTTLSTQRISNEQQITTPSLLQSPSTSQLLKQQHQITRSYKTILHSESGNTSFHSQTHPTFSSLGITSPALLKRLTGTPKGGKHRRNKQATWNRNGAAGGLLGLECPSAVQSAVYERILEGDDLVVGAETGSGKTLAYLMPLVEDILKRKHYYKSNNPDSTVIDPGYDYGRAVILVPNKELAHQAMKMAASISGGLNNCVVWGADALGMDYNAQQSSSSSSDNVPEEDIVRLALLSGDLNAPQDFPPFRYATSTSPNHIRQSPPDLIFATPANLGPLALSPKNIDLFADISTVVIDEADMLLDGGYIRQLNNVLMGFRRADRLVNRYDDISFKRKSSESESVEEEEDELGVEETDVEEEAEDKQKQKPKKTQHIFVAATLPDYGLRSVDAYLNKKFPNATSITMDGMHNARHYGLENETQTIWNEIEDNQHRMRRVVDVLQSDRSEVGEDGRGLKGEKVMIFLNTVKDVDGATNGLRRAGINAVPYHAKIPLDDRTSNLDMFRRYRAPTAEYEEGEDDDDEIRNEKNTVPVLVCTDVASRGLDIPGVTAIIQLQFALNVVSHLHRMGRCGRAGNRDGRGIIFYGPRERELVEVVREAETQQSRMTLKQDVEDLDDDGLEGSSSGGKVQKAFSRKRGFTKKRKKQRKKAMEAEYD